MSAEAGYCARVIVAAGRGGPKQIRYVTHYNRSFDLTLDGSLAYVFPTREDAFEHGRRFGRTETFPRQVSP